MQISLSVKEIKLLIKALECKLDVLYNDLYFKSVDREIEKYSNLADKLEELLED